MRLALLVVALCTAAYATPVYVGTASNSNSGVQTTITVSYTATTGNALFVGCGSYRGTPLTSLVISDGTNTYTLDKFQGMGSGETASLYHSFNVTGGTLTITCTANTGVIFGMNLRVVEVSTATGGVDGTPTGANGASTPADSGTTTTTNGIDVLIGVIATAGATSSVGTGWTIAGSTVAADSCSLMMEYKIVSSAGAYAATATVGARWIAIVAGYIGTSGAGGALRHRVTQQ